MLANYEVGKSYDEFRCMEQVKMNLDGSGLTLYLMYNNPSNEEVSEYSSNHPMQIGYVYMHGVLLFVIRFGNQQWIDVPYHPLIGARPTIPEEIEGGQGLSLFVCLADCSTGVVKQLRLIGLETIFSRKLCHLLREMSNKPFDPVSYDTELNEIYATYRTKDLARMMDVVCKIK